jgi:hypothetical protein
MMSEALKNEKKLGKMALSKKFNFFLNLSVGDASKGIF